MTEIINEKVQLLYDFCILRYRKGMKEDSREDKVRKLLADCGNEYRMQTILHDVLVDKIKLNELLEKKGLI